MFNISRLLPTHRGTTGGLTWARSEDDVAASIRDYFGKNLTRIIEEDLRALGVEQQDLAKRLNVHTQQISRWKKGQIPKIGQVQELLDVLNLYLRVEPEELFENPIKAIARRAGYDIVKRS